jgi:glycosyltransferase involved in cell wall biosynthesis
MSQMGIQELVSVVIPTFNNGAFLQQAIESVLEQSYRNHEIVVVDDGSTDDTREMLKPYLDKITYIFQENRGASVARNQGILHSRGAYIAFLDADDVWLQGKLDRQMQFFRDHQDVGLVCGELEHWMECGERIPIEHTRGSGSAVGSNGDVIVKDAFKLLLGRCYIMTSTVVMSRDSINAVGLFDESLQVEEDRHLWLRVARKYPIGKVHEILVRKRSHQRNLTLRSKLCVECRIRIFEPIVDDSGPLNDQDLVALRKELASLYCQWGTIFLEEKNREAARKRFLKSLALRIQPACMLLYLFSFMNESLSNAVKGCYRACYRRYPALRV